MLIRLLGWFWVLTGLIFLIRPGFFRRRLIKKSYKTIRRYLIAITLPLAALFIVASTKVKGALSIILLVMGVIGMIKVFFFAKSKAAERIIAWYIKQPLHFYRIGALAQLVIGTSILLLTRR